LLPLLGVLLIVVASVCGFVAFVFVGGSGSQSDTARIGVVVSVEPQAYFVKRVGGKRVQVSVMIPPGKSPATYEPSSRQLRRLDEAALYVKVGHPLFPFEKVHFKKITRANPDLVIVDTSRGVDLIPDDPHIWLSPDAVLKAVDAIAQALIQIDPNGRAFYRRNARRFVRDIMRLKKDIRRMATAANGRRFFVFHPAWSYLARDFGLIQKALQQDCKAPGPRDVQRFIDTARRLRAEAIFVQKQFDQRVARVVADAVGAKIVVLDPLARNWQTNLRRAAQAIIAQLR
jgi:zinc transport system substrate-binding protein